MRGSRLEQPKTVREMCGFDRWLQELDQSTCHLPLACALQRIALAAADAFGARLWFVEILGKRWSYLAGYVCDGPAGDAISRIPLDAGIGLVAESWGRLQHDDRAKLIAFLKQHVPPRRGAHNHTPS